MNLLIISHTPHHLNEEGNVAGWAPTVNENDIISKFFDKVIVLGVLHKTPAPSSCKPYSSSNIEFQGYDKLGGTGLVDKLKLISAIPKLWQLIHTQVSKMSANDMVYVRCPCHIGLIACLYFAIHKNANRRWFKYAGNWKPDRPDALSYRIQRWFLEKNHCRAKVTVNGKWPDQPKHVLSFLNPCMFQDELDKYQNLPMSKKLEMPVKLCFVGRMERNKGIFLILQCAKILKRNEVNFEINFAGDGVDIESFRQAIKEDRLEDVCKILGPQARDELFEMYRQCHFLLLPSTASEGWPKVLSEAMANRCVPLANAISSIPQVLEEYDCGKAISILTPDAWAECIGDLIKDDASWTRLSQNGAKSAHHFSYEAMAKKLESEVLS